MSWRNGVPFYETISNDRHSPTKQTSPQNIFITIRKCNILYRSFIVTRCLFAYKRSIFSYSLNDTLKIRKCLRHFCLEGKKHNNKFKTVSSYHFLIDRDIKKMKKAISEANAIMIKTDTDILLVVHLLFFPRLLWKYPFYSIATVELCQKSTKKGTTIVKQKSFGDFIDPLLFLNW